MDAIRFLVTNTYLLNGSNLRRQAIGIPMGTNCAPTLANLFLYHFESAYIDRLVRQRLLEQAFAFHLTFRYIDDSLSIDNPQWKEACVGSTGIYPKELILNDTTPATGRVHFIGMNVEYEGKGFRLSVHDKRADFPFDVRRYPLVSSLLPTSIPYGVFTSQLHRGYRICTDLVGFMEFVSELTERMLANGCSGKRLIRLFRTFFSRYDGCKYPGHSINQLCRKFRYVMGSLLL
jgi:hypothetical protein